MKITVTDLERVDPPKEARDLISLAGDRGYVSRGGWETVSNPFRNTFGLRITGGGQDVALFWRRDDREHEILTSALAWQPDVETWQTLDGAEHARTILGL